jgi:TolA-binding protein|tara:strand:+ start:1018 stop:1368 length:351 start_codon:yes stop_codon:yes gene_type:complete
MDESNIWTAAATLVIALTSTKAWDFWKHRESIAAQAQEAERDDQNLYRDDLRIKLDDYREELRKLYIKREKELFDMNDKIRELTESLAEMRVKVEFLERENTQLRKQLEDRDGGIN